MHTYVLAPSEEWGKINARLGLVGKHNTINQKPVFLEKIKKELVMEKEDIYIVSKDKGAELIPHKKKIERNLFIWEADTFIKYGDFDAIEKVEKEAMDCRDWKKLRTMNNLAFSFDNMEKNIMMHARPSCMQIETSSYCNARCIMCPHNYRYNKDAKHLEYSMLDKFSGLFPFCENIVLHGNGEPLLHPQINELLEQYHNMGIKLMINTNMSLLPHVFLEKADELFDVVNISCDASNAYLYESIRRGLKFNQFVENVKLFRGKNPNLKMIMSVVAMRQNISDVENIVCFAHKLGFDEVHFGMLGTNRILDNDKDELCYYPNFTKLFFSKARKTAEKIGIKILIPEQYEGTYDLDETILAQEQMQMHQVPMFRKQLSVGNNYCMKLNKYIQYDGVVESIGKENDISCLWPFKNIRIDVDGNVGICCRTGDKIIDNILEHRDFYSIWNGPVYTKIRERFYKGERPALCANCEYINGMRKS